MFVYKFTAKVRFAHSAGRSKKSEAKTTKKQNQLPNILSSHPYCQFAIITGFQISLLCLLTTHTK